MQCGKCGNGCPAAALSGSSPAEIIKRLQTGAGGELLDLEIVWSCVSCETCITRCPNEVDIARMMDVLRQMAIETGVGAKDLSGPVGILAILAAQFNTDYRLALSFLVLLNVNLAILNLLPVPVLDGGHILMSIIEKIRRRPLSVKFVEYTTTAFAVLLIGFMLYVTYFDLGRMRQFKALFKSETQIEQAAPAGATPSPAPAK